MNRRILSRRTMAVLAAAMLSLAIIPGGTAAAHPGATGTVATSTKAVQAAGSSFAGASRQLRELVPASVVPGCSGNTVIFGNGAIDGQWTVTAGGEVVFPVDGDTQPGPGEGRAVYLPAGSGDIEVDYDGSPSPDWGSPAFPLVFPEGAPPQYCAAVPDIEVTQPTCDQPGQVLFLEVPVGIGLDDDVFYTLDGAEVPMGSAQPVAPGTHTARLAETGELGLVLVHQEWVFTIDEPECPTDETPAETDGATTDQAPGLADTGTSTGLLALGAALLVALGASLLVLGRRRHNADAAG